MLGRYAKAQLMVRLCGGLVGPIFLAVYFALGKAERPYIALDVLGRIVDHRRRRPDRTGAGELQREVRCEDEDAGGQWRAQALAQVTGISETGTRINGQPLVKINLHIQGPGLTHFDVQDSVFASVTRLPLYRQAHMTNPSAAYGVHSENAQGAGVLAGPGP